jgi:alkylation response protein AidB-like acyl-CoA dehydrogenase
MLLARTNPEAPKHQGITWFALDMHQPGVEVRPLKEMTGHTMFSEVFFTDAVVRDSARIGDVNNGWSVAQTTLLYERSGMGAGGQRGMGMARAGTRGDLQKRAGDFVRTPRTPAPRAQRADRTPSSPAQQYIDLARERGLLGHGAIRQRIVQSHILGTLARLNTERHKAVRAAGGDIPGVANFSKLLMANILRHNRDLGLELLGPRGTLHTYDDARRGELAKEVGGSAAVAMTSQALSAQALPIYGGTDQIQRNIIGERVLGLPKEPGDLAQVPFNQLPKNG